MGEKSIKSVLAPVPLGALVASKENSHAGVVDWLTSGYLCLMFLLDNKNKLGPLDAHGALSTHRAEHFSADGVPTNKLKRRSKTN